MTLPKNQAVSKRLLATTTALILMAVFAGCSSDNEEDPDNTVETSDAETEYVPASADGPAQNVPEPNLPAVATENTEEGAEATLKYFWEGIDHVRLTGEPSSINQVSYDTCQFCSDLANGWEEVYLDGSWAGLDGTVDLDVREVELKRDKEQENDMAFVSFVMTEPAAEFYEDGQLLQDESFNSESTAEWWAELSYDATAQMWSIEWVGLEDHRDEDRS